MLANRVAPQGKGTADPVTCPSTDPAGRRIDVSVRNAWRSRNIINTPPEKRRKPGRQRPDQAAEEIRIRKPVNAELKELYPPLPRFTISADDDV